jgi:hypothetical protein
MEADSVLRLANCDLKSVGYFSSQLPLLKESKWDADKQYKWRPIETPAGRRPYRKGAWKRGLQVPYSQDWRSNTSPERCSPTLP